MRLFTIRFSVAFGIERILAAQRQLIAMLATFYKDSPTRDSPFRQIMILPYEGGWRVRLSGGEQSHPKYSKELKVIPAKSFDDAQKLFDKACRQLQDKGWKPYKSFDPW